MCISFYTDFIKNYIFFVINIKGIIINKSIVIYGRDFNACNVYRIYFSWYDLKIDFPF
jgi:hypothetical protein